MGPVAQSVKRLSCRDVRSRDRIPVDTRFSAPVQTDPGAHPASCKMGTGYFPVVTSGRGVLLTNHPLLVLWQRKCRAIYLSPIDRTACTGHQCLYSTATTLLPVWAVRPVNSLSVCTVQLYLYSLLSVGLYRNTVHVQYRYT